MDRQIPPQSGQHFDWPQPSFQSACRFGENGMIAARPFDALPGPAIQCLVGARPAILYPLRRGKPTHLVRIMGLIRQLTRQKIERVILRMSTAVLWRMLIYPHRPNRQKAVREFSHSGCCSFPDGVPVRRKELATRRAVDSCLRLVLELPMALALRTNIPHSRARLAALRKKKQDESVLTQNTADLRSR
jgi:hypothetical protein